MSLLESYTNNIQQGSVLEEEQAAEAIRFIMDGDASEDQIASFLTALHARGEEVSEITGAARVMWEKAFKINAPEDSVDCCGTGGDGTGTWNVSTAVALVAASCGAPVAKHGNRSASSKSGAADVLEALDINIDLSKEALEEALKTLNFCFLMAPRHHQAMKHVVPVRKKLGHRTIFNLLGPLANPAGTRRQLIGVFDRKWVKPMAETLKNLGTKKAWVVHGKDGMDEITITDGTYVAVLEDGEITEKEMTPADFGIAPSPIDRLKGGDANENAAALKVLLTGEPNAYRDIVLVNTAAVLNIHGSASSLQEGMDVAARAIDDLKTLDLLDKYKNFSQEHGA